MPDVLIDLRRPASDGVDVGAVGAVECVPTSRREVDGAIVLPSPFAARLVDGAVTVDLAETGLDWCWRITERVRDGVTRYVTVPASGVTLDYADLADVDPDTLDPTAEPEAAWTIALAALETTDLADVAATAPTDGQVLAWDAAEGHYAPLASTLGDLTDVTTAGQAAGEALVSNGATWAPSAAAVILEGDSRLTDPRTPTAHTHTLSEVTDAGGAAALDVGTTAGTLAAGDDSRITGALPAANLDTAATALDANPASALRVQQDARLSSTYAPIPTGTPDGTQFYRDDGTWATLSGGGTGTLTGSGSPIGSVTPSAVGELYTDTAATTGARVWVSTGTTNTAWQVIAADTGRRDVSGDLTNGWVVAPSSGYARLRRVNNRVSFSASLSSAGQTGANIYSIPTGFRVADDLWLRGPTYNATGTYLKIEANGVLHVIRWYDGTIAVDSAMRLNLSWITNDAWPTTLPGTA